MARIHVLPEHVANKIAAGEVVERPASVVKELLENSLDAGARRIRIQVEAGGRKLIQVTDDGCGMVRDDAMLAFERHATSKIKDAEGLLSISTLGFRGEALPSIASVSRLRLETRASAASSGAQGEATESGTVVEIAGGKLLRVEEAGLPPGTSITVRDLFFNMPARKKFLRAEATELSHIASLVTHYSLAHPDKHFELHSSAATMLMAPPVASHAERIFQVFGRETLDQLVAVAATTPLAHSGLPKPPPWAKAAPTEEEGMDPSSSSPGELRLHGFISRPEVQKLNRNSIFVFVNGRLVRDRLIQHALTDAYRNILPASVFPVVLLFLELPSAEVDANVHPSKVEVRFRQQNFVHDFVRDAVRETLMKSRPAPHFATELRARPTASPALAPSAPSSRESAVPAFALEPPQLAPLSERLHFEGAIEVQGNAAVGAARMPRQTFTPLPTDTTLVSEAQHCSPAVSDPAASEPPPDLASLPSLKPLGQVRDSFILAVNGDGLWIIDQHVAHERVLFERLMRQRASERVESQRLLMPMILELSAAQQAVFAELSDELRRNGFEVEPFGSRTVAVKTAPSGLEAAQLERMLHELLDAFAREERAVHDLEQARRRIAASVACHAAIKVNMPLEPPKMEWLLRELAQTDCPMTCPHGRPVVLRYSVRDIERAFKRI